MNTYVTAEQYTAYANERGITINAATLNADLVLSADFIGIYYNLLDAYKLPDIAPEALAEFTKPALKAVELQQAGRLVIDFAALNAGMIKRERKKADVLEKEVEYQDGTTATFKPRVPELDLLMRPFVELGGQLVKMRV